AQRTLASAPDLLAVERGPLADGRRLLALYNVTDTPFALENGGDAIIQALGRHTWQALDLDNPWNVEGALSPYAVRWLIAYN
ncbi:MAG: alpha-amylase, partial [Halomonas sp.]